MNRSALGWMAAGAALGAAASIFASIAIVQPTDPLPYLKIEDNWLDFGRDPNPEVGLSSALIAHQCGSTEFESNLAASIDGGPPFTLIPLNSANVRAFRCISRLANERGANLDVIMRTENNAQTH